jgi:hypothetical protein
MRLFKPTATGMLHSSDACAYGQDREGLIQPFAEAGFLFSHSFLYLTNICWTSRCDWFYSGAWRHPGELGRPGPCLSGREMAGEMADEQVIRKQANVFQAMITPIQKNKTG